MIASVSELKQSLIHLETAKNNSRNAVKRLEK